ncbi:histone deacetylase complex subunit SAP30 Sin3-binding protein (macronuclear) [Tetrahymena thermophila SB210]|uniref:Histone deacetylase complex subunit SAP30 Sin3-binding protein n=1 Tax=Tetrahymena thermophila (strain SB210) TaxID=312017 RepID=Q233F1_TETTS|nr:histone deacetylase complex subunit SAP30 Sin3-binding protein [Tetrahymena thermophila SB210]EAR91629.2 histone deacetylase complex subunit SAP30 Sin3-binding protein [Tetrahymena thermophila SB210]|eukprot:XP_001011874.2 histone deacetylase complex subunit SAP30 Sin3-binding protein [Tetrahymena thermophila SB210]
MSKSNQPQEDLEEQYLPDFTKLSNASLQKYRMYYNIECTEEELVEKVKKHFKSTLDINSLQLYEKIFKLKREEREELKNRKTLRTKKEIQKSNF